MSTNDLKSHKGKTNPLLPVEKILSTEGEQAKFIRLLAEEAEGYLTRASRLFGCSVRTVQRRIVDFPVFNEAIKFVQSAYHQMRLDKLESVSYDEAKQPKNFRERKFFLESLDPSRFRSTQTNIQATSIHISLGFDTPTPVDRQPEKLVEYECKEETLPEPDDGLDAVDMGDI